ncbi:MAG: L,D-transpeptidase [Verrucomicrobiota bacterium]
MTNVTETNLPRWIQSRCQDLSQEIPQDILWVSIPEQRLRHYHNQDLENVYTISTSKAPPSCIENSFGTPTGMHIVADKIGEGANAGTIFESRVPTRHVSDLSPDEQRKNYVTTRIMRMRGLEPGHNAGPGRDTYDRYVYIHGTNHPERIGKPFSGGCVELKDSDVILLFSKIDTGAIVAISA